MRCLTALVFLAETLKMQKKRRYLACACTDVPWSGVLAGGVANSSATFQFADQVQQAKLGINGCALFFLRLPNSGIELDVPLIARFPVGNQPGAGLQPISEITNDARHRGR